MAALGNTNIPARPYAPTDYSKQPSGQNPYGFGYQRVAGQVAPQAPAQGYNSNFMAGAQVGRQQKQLGYGPQPQTQVPPQMPGNVSYQPMPQPAASMPMQQAYAPMHGGVGGAPVGYFQTSPGPHNFDQFANRYPAPQGRIGY